MNKRWCLRRMVVVLVAVMAVALVVNTFTDVFEMEEEPGEALLASEVLQATYNIVKCQDLTLQEPTADVELALNSPSFNYSTFDLSKAECQYDQSNNYKVVSNIISPFMQTNNSNIVCLSSQTSVDKLFWISYHMKTWSGPISVSVFIPDVDFTIAMKMMSFLRHCHEDLDERLVIHMVYPISLPPVLKPTRDYTFSCSRPEVYNEKIVKRIRSRAFVLKMEKTKYPQNLLRNVARKGWISDFYFSPDIDMISIPNSYNNLVTFLQTDSVKNCIKCAYIIPAYEVSNTVRTNPKDKRELLSYIKKNLAQTFHRRVFPLCQAHSQLSKWEAAAIISDNIHVIYTILDWKLYWEPIYVSAASETPDFDEMFVGYGFTRNSQVFEMAVASYKWLMLDSSFLIHRGFQTRRSRSIHRRREMHENEKLYKGFVAKVKRRYNVAEDDPRFTKKKKNNN